MNGRSTYSPPIKIKFTQGKNITYFQFQVGPHKVSILRVSFIDFLQFKIRNLTVLTTHCPHHKKFDGLDTGWEKKKKIYPTKQRPPFFPNKKECKNLPTVPPRHNPTANSPCLQDD